MFERFTDPARGALSLAQEEARELRHNFIGTEHLLLGVLGCGDEAVTLAVAGYDLALADVRASVTELIAPGDEAPGGRPPFTSRAKKVLELSLREALAMGHDHIGPAHILLGILREGDGVGAQVLRRYGVEHEVVRLQLAQFLGAGGGRRRGRGRGRNIRGFVGETPFVGSAPALRLAARASKLARGERLGTQHLLLGLFEDDQSLAAKVLDSLGVTKDQVKAAIAEIGVDGTSDAPPKVAPQPTNVTLAEGVEIRITDPQLAELAATGQLEELLAEVVRRAKKPA